ncbi:MULTISPECIES: type VI secretion system tube protein Hcp [unclassified Caballeronia]|uniref:Hcp family type VI secretion system effector n=1 Tax=unclassified Caballeronia TaxID=2646786 RepID=UPI00285FDCC4|nr:MULTISPECIES: type VI secretion system tube protein Hcp [unclassified Caballeronia]MDR5758676.1 type VI secretion system tube protein Hcp [Caballeronia sp. LZ035]MDR5780867.1 type VI secretion system tube protein Hcp [Caballeronia sp. LZ065]
MDTILLKIDKIKGNSALTGHADQIILSSYSFGIQLPMNPDPSATERTLGRAMFSEVHCTKITDLATPSLYRACAAGDKLGDATISIGRTENGKFMELMTYVLSDAMVSNVNTSGAGQPSDAFAIGYSKITAVYTQQKTDSTQKGKTSFGWDVAADADAAPAAS